MKAVNKLMPYVHGIILALLWRIIRDFCYSVYGVSGWEIVLVFLLPSCSAVSLYFCFRRVQTGLWWRVLAAVGIAMTAVLLYKFLLDGWVFFPPSENLTMGDGFFLSLYFIVYFLRSVEQQSIVLIFLTIRNHKRKKEQPA